MPPGGIRTTILASARPQTYAFDCAATGIGAYVIAGLKDMTRLEGVRTLNIHLRKKRVESEYCRIHMLLLVSYLYECH
jgi:hypothetical protein